MSNVYIRSQNREKLYAFGICFNCLQYEEKHDCKRGKIWEYTGEQRGKCVCKVKEEKDVECYKRATEALQSYGREREGVRHEQRAG